jgi:phosphonate transport system substrate-binding protein
MIPFRRAILFFSIFFTLWASHCQARPLVFSIHPFANPARIYRSFQPLITYLAGEIGRDIKIKIAPNYMAHVKAMRQGGAELGFVGPSPYVRLTDKGAKIELLARLRMRDEINDRIVIICRRSAPYRELSDLAGTDFAFGDRQSFGSHYMPLWLLAQNGVSLAGLASYGFVRSHDNVILSVLHGDFTAGGVRLDVFQRYEDRPLRVLAGPFQIPPHAIICQQNLDADLKQKIRRSLLNLRDSHILQSLNPKMEQFEATADGEYDQARRVIHFAENNHATNP